MKRGVLCLYLLLAWMALPGRVEAQPITGIMSGFEVTNHCGEPADDFHLIVTGVSCEDVLDMRMPRGWGFDCQTLPDGSTHFQWTGLFPIYEGQSAFFGLELAGSPDWRVDCAYWTSGGRLLLPMVSWPNQRWNAATGQFVDIVNGYRPPLNPFVFIQRETALSPLGFPLPFLTWNETQGLPWQPVPGPELIPNLPDSFFDIFLETLGMNAALVRYPVTSPQGQLQARYVNQLELSPWNPPGLFSNFDAWNWTDVCVNDFHVVLQGVGCANLQAGSQGLFVPPGWGVQCLDLPNGGLEIRWTTLDGSCVSPGDFRHFGYGLNTLLPFSIVASYWTWDGVPILPFMEPVQQTWLWDGGSGVTDRVWGFPPLVEPQGVTIRRDYAIQPLSPLPLYQLNWEESAELGWLPADPLPQWVPPDSFFDVFFTFPQPPLESAALLIRYEVTTPDGTTGLRFVNQALLPVPQPPIPPIHDLRIDYLGEVEPGLGHFRLSWTPPVPPVPMPLEYHIYSYSDPYDPATAQPLGYTIDSFFDIYMDVTGVTEIPGSHFRVRTDYQPID